MHVLYKLAPSWEGAWAGFGPARQAGQAQRPVFEKMFFGHYWGRHGSVSGIRNPEWLPGFLGSAVLAPGVRKYRNPPGGRKKTPPGTRKPWAKGRNSGKRVDS